VKTKLNRTHHRETAAIVGVGFAGSAFAVGVSWLFYVMTLEYVRLVAQVITFQKFNTQ
jgi:hypothetical protein